VVGSSKSFGPAATSTRFGIGFAGRVAVGIETGFGGPINEDPYEDKGVESIGSLVDEVSADGNSHLPVIGLNGIVLSLIIAKVTDIF
jgi:hypothetical protein